MNHNGFARVTAASHKTSVADPYANAEAAIELLGEYADSDVVVMPELSISGYSCGDLFAQDALLSACLKGLESIAEAAHGDQMVVVGLPLRVEGQLYNTAAVIQCGRVLGVVPKQFLPNYQEFYEGRWFIAADGSEPKMCSLGEGDSLGLRSVPFGIDLLFRHGPMTLGVEMCEDLWMPTSPSSQQAIAGANVIVNLSASNELVGKADWRQTLVRCQSGRCLAAYAYASCGPSESTTDVVFSGHCMVAENGAMLAESHRVGDADSDGWRETSSATADVDLLHLQHDRQITGSWQQAAKRASGEFRFIEAGGRLNSDGSLRNFSGQPFVPSAEGPLAQRCAEIFGIQVASLAKRIEMLPDGTQLNIGVSGGLDSTLALLVAAKTCREMGLPPTTIAGVTMPGFGTTSRTLTAARDLMQHLGTTADEIDIRQMCLDTFIALGHKPFGIDVAHDDLDKFESELGKVPAEDLHDLTFENVQARMRTMILMSRGFVLGTGDMSEQALGWSTYNGDHMSMYNVNTSVPKTLVKFLVQYAAKTQFDGAARETLMGVVETPISPELLPPSADGAIAQLTESTLGAYELHDFFLYHMVRFGASPRRILQLANLATFSRNYEIDEVRRTLQTFLKRFFTNQFKRSCVPDGPKVGSVSLSPRGDWRMPSDAVYRAWLQELDEELEEDA
ncbi:MAG: NAD(+) synthase [Aureliella sp.]